MGRPPPPNAAPWPDDHVPTAFQRAVLEAVRHLGPGDLVTYGDLAQELGRPGAAQAVANVLRAVPDLPWWRVVPSEGRLYRTHAPVQAPLLEAEGHRVDEHRRVHPGPGTAVQDTQAVPAVRSAPGSDPACTRPCRKDPGWTPPVVGD